MPSCLSALQIAVLHAQTNCIDLPVTFGSVETGTDSNAQVMQMCEITNLAPNLFKFPLTYQDATADLFATRGTV